MVEATPSAWRDICERCGRGFGEREPRWVEERRYTVHTHWPVQAAQHVERVREAVHGLA